MMYSALAASAALFSMVSADMTCNGVFGYEDGAPAYPLDTCIPTKSSGVESSVMYSCEGGDVMSMTYDTLDCSGDDVNGTTSWVCPDSGTCTVVQHCMRDAKSQFL